MDIDKQIWIYETLIEGSKIEATAADAYNDISTLKRLTEENKNYRLNIEDLKRLKERIKKINKIKNNFDE